MKNSIISTTLFAVLSINAMAQSETASAGSGTETRNKNNPGDPEQHGKTPRHLSKMESAGNKEYFIYAYDKAIESYSSDEYLSPDGQRKLAASYYKMNQGLLAQESYGKLETSESGQQSEDHFNYAMSFRATGNYSSAAVWMDKFAARSPGDRRAISYQENKAGLDKLLKNDENIKVTHQGINTGAEDFGPVYYQDKVVFASSRTSKFFPKKSYTNNKAYLDIYVSEIKNDQLEKPVAFDKKLNGNMNDGPASFNQNGSLMAYGRNNSTLTKKELIVNLEIYFRTYEKGKWSKPAPFIYNSKDYSVEHPALSADGKTMYFSSNMPGGYGGMDVYKVTSDANGKWGTPENAGNTVNTEGDEVFPFFLQSKNTLFFASNGHFGLGGLDIFSSIVRDSKFNHVTNLGAPLNSSLDDFSMITDSMQTHGFFASNRAGGSGDDDLYAVTFLSGKKINGIAKDDREKPVANAFITLLNNLGNVIDTMTSNNEGFYSFPADQDRDYKLTGAKERYTEGNIYASTFGSVQIIIADVTLGKIPEKIEAVVVKHEKPVANSVAVHIDASTTAVLNPIYFDYHESSIRPDAAKELDKMVKVMNDNPNMTVTLLSHTDCRASAEYNQCLSDKRAKSSSDYIKRRITDPSRISGKGYGESRLINKCACSGEEISGCTELEHQQNRRTEFIITTHAHSTTSR
jgi:outer membrane protein OmpA-like peptidoglycan-associated protein